MLNDEAKLDTLAREEKALALEETEWKAFDEAAKEDLAHIIVLLRHAIDSSEPEERDVAERMIDQLLGVIDAESVARKFDDLASIALLLVGNDRGAGRTLVARIQDAPYVWRKLVIAAQVAWRLSALEALALFELADADDLSRRKHPTTTSIRPDARELLVRLGLAALDHAARQTQTSGLPASRLRVLSLGWMMARLVKHDLDWRKMHARSYDPMQDEVTTGEYLRIVDVFDGGVLVASFILALAPHPAGFGRGSALGDLEVLSSLLRDLFAGEVPAHLPHLRIDLDKLLDGAVGGCMNGFASAAPAI